MKLDIVAGSQNDEFYTPREAVEPLLEFVQNATVWCPFDTDRSHFVGVLSRRNDVVFSHLSTGENFLTCEVPECDYIISNPPYSKKNEVFSRLFSIGKPFAMLVGVVGLFESKFRFELFARNKFEILYFDKRISYFKSYDDTKPALHPPFSSVYLTSKLLPERIVFRNYKGPR